jgi:2-polyprenyl-3-methyl-5-hydroxy-6-metoxy-1,4-benzoquinol methylase
VNEFRPAERVTAVADGIRDARLADGILDAAHLRALALEGLPIRVAEAACGTGALTCAIALAGPSVRVVGCDAEPSALVRALINARSLSVDDRVTFRPGAASTLIGDGPYDLVTIVATAGGVEAAIRKLAPCAGSVVDRGAVIIAEPNRSTGFRLWRISDLSTPGPQVEQAQRVDRPFTTTTTTTETEAS